MSEAPPPAVAGGAIAAPQPHPTWRFDRQVSTAVLFAFLVPPARIKMLHQHDAAVPVGVWDEVRPDARGLYVRGRILPHAPTARMCAALVRAGALDGLSIGFRTLKARADSSARVRVLERVDLWEVSLVAFPMLREARLSILPQPQETP